MDKHKQSALTLGPLPEEQPAVSQADVPHISPLPFLNQKED